MTIDPARLQARCPRCSADLWDHRAGEWTLKTPMLKLRADGEFAARCPTQGCSADVPVRFLALQDPPAEPAPTPARRRRRVLIRRPAVDE